MNALLHVSYVLLTKFYNLKLIIFWQTFRDPSPPPERPRTRLSFLRAATPLFGRSSTPSDQTASSTMERRAKGKRKTLLNLLSRKRKRREQEVEVPREPVHLNFLFVGSKEAGQTSLLLWVVQRRTDVPADCV